MIIPEQPTWKIQDSIKVQAFMACARRYFFEHVLGWRKEEPNIHLVFGQAVHLAMECFYPVGETPNLSAEAGVEAFNAFFEYYRKFFSEMSDDENSPKTPANFLRAIPLYISTYKPTDDFEILYSEVAGSVMVSDSRCLHLKMDLVARGRDEGIFSLEHKTGGRFSTGWANQWMQKTQINTYAFALSMMFPDEDTYGIKVNGMFIKDPPKLKLDGLPYANAKDTEFHRVPIQKTIPQLEDWLININFWLEFIEIEFDNLGEVQEDDEVMAAFPKNTESCGSYGGCLYQDYCSAWLNPLRKCESPPMGFKEEFWDPRSMREDAKKILDL